MKARTRNIKTATISMITMIVVVAVFIGPTAVLAQTDTRDTQVLEYSPRLRAGEDVAKFRGTARELRSLLRTSPRKATPLPEPRRTATTNHSLTQASAPSAPSNPPSGNPGGGGDELAQAQAILAGYISRYPILAGTTVTIGATPGGHQAVAYYTVGRIVISPTHTATLDRILGHEIWHVIDYRDNGRIDWGENVPPSNYP